MNGRVNRTHRFGFISIMSWFMAAFLVAGLVAAMGAPVLGQEVDEGDGYAYTVQDGDSWDIVAAKTGVSVEALQEANPDAVRDTGWLLTGETLNIPLPDDAESTVHTVGSGESWSTIAEEYGISLTMLQAANQKSVRAGLVLYKGEKLLIPPAPAAAEEPAEEAMEEAEVEAVGTPEAESDAEPEAEGESTPGAPADEVPAEEAGEAVEDAVTDTETPEATEEVTSTEVMTEPVTETVIEAEVPDAAAAPEEGVAEGGEEGADDIAGEEAEDAAEEEVAVAVTCPEALADYPDAIVALLQSQAGSEEFSAADVVGDFLTTCGAAVENGVVAADLTGDGQEDLVVVYQNPVQESAFVESDLIILSPGEEGYEVAYRARAAGEVRLISNEDINDDGQVDVVWIDTTCGASTCFDTVNVRSWDGSVWADWTDGTITMAYANVELADVSEEGSGQEIELTGGIYGSVGAGPQRSRTEVWSSVDGAAYTLTEKTYSDSECLYHTVLDANRALADAETPEDLADAKALYEKAVTDESLIKCWVRPGELEELRSFSLFRLALIAATEGDTQGAADRVTELAATYPDAVLVEPAQTWLELFEENGDISAACDAVTAFAEENPEAWEILADYGYTNPSFEASDVCPVPDVSGEDTGEESAEDGATGASPRSDPGAEGSDEAAADASDEADDDVEAAEVFGADLPSCPDTLVDYAAVLPAVLEDAGGDEESVQRWLYSCGALTDDRGAVVVADLNGDEADDFVLFPTVISDVGLGPDGAQGAVYILHSEPDGGYGLAASPEVFGEPSPLAIEDLNADGNVDVAWTVEGCSTFCMLEVEIATWDGEEYASVVAPGAAIAAGEATFVPIEEGDVGAGKSLVLSGGVSGTPEGGLTVPHEEVWQSVDGGPFQRIRWVYDRDASGSDCMGLRMVEADVALQASDVLGYGPAIELYAEALDPNLQACSIFGLQPEDEFDLLQGLASFRLIQAQALGGDTEAAQTSLDLMTMGMPDSSYTEAAQQWLSEFSASADAEAACSAIASILEENPDLWQITDHYGYNHPALAAEQICYSP